MVAAEEVPCAPRNDTDGMLQLLDLTLALAALALAAVLVRRVARSWGAAPRRRPLLAALAIVRLAAVLAWTALAPAALPPLDRLAPRCSPAVAAGALRLLTPEVRVRVLFAHICLLHRPSPAVSPVHTVAIRANLSQALLLAAAAFLAPLPLKQHALVQGLAALSIMLACVPKLAAVHASLPGSASTCADLVRSMRLVTAAVVPGLPVDPPIQQHAACGMLHAWACLLVGVVLPTAVQLAAAQSRKHRRRQQRAAMASPSSNPDGTPDDGSPAGSEHPAAPLPMAARGPDDLGDPDAHAFADSDSRTSAQYPSSYSSSSSRTGSAWARMLRHVERQGARVLHASADLAAHLVTTLTLVLPGAALAWAVLEAGASFYSP